MELQGVLTLGILAGGSVLWTRRGARSRGLHSPRAAGGKEAEFEELQMEKGRPYRIPQGLQKVGSSLSFFCDQDFH